MSPESSVELPELPVSGSANEVLVPGKDAAMATHLRRKPTPLRDRDSSDPARQVVEVVQRGRMILDVSATDLEAAEKVLGPFHPTSWHFRSALEEARRSWDRLRAELGGATLDASLAELPLTYLVLGGTPPIVLIPIAGQTYRADRVAGTSLAPTQWRLTRLRPPLDDGPYYACRLQDGSTQCDCAEWIYQIAGTDAHALCKHLAALDALGWI